MSNPRIKAGFNKPFQEQVDFFVQKINLPTERYDDILKDAHDKAFVVAGAMKADLLNDLNAAVGTAIKDGKSIQWFRKEFSAIVQKHGWEGWTGSDTKAGRDWRTRVIYQTNMATSYAAGRWQQLNDPDLLKVAPYWKYVHNDTVSHPRPMHLSWSGLVLRHDDPWWRTHFPPNGWGCRCRVTAVSTREYSGQQAPNDGTHEVKDSRGNWHTVPKGIDYGWDYAPGATVTKPLQQFIVNKAAALPIQLAKDFTQAVNQQFSKQSLVSDAFMLPKSGNTKKVADTVVKIIDGLHAIENLPKIAVVSSSSKSFQGRYSYKSISGQPVSIALSSASVNPEMTVGHEIGHFIDHQAFGKAGVYSSSHDAEFTAFRKAVDDSIASKTLQALFNKSTSRAEKKYINYYLSKPEQWARAYAQWVAVRSQNPAMLNQVARILNNTATPFYSASQWDSADFELIAAAIDDIFKAKGWLK